MDLADIYKKQQQDIETFKTVRDSTWVNLKKEHETLMTAFGGRANMPEEYRNRIDNQITDFQKDWSMEGDRYKDMVTQHKKQIEAVTGKPANEEAKQQNKKESDMITEKQKELEKVIKMQQAIRQKNQERKRKR